MQIPASVTLCTAVSTLIVVGWGMLSDDSGGQDSVFSEAQAYERFMGRWSRSLAPLLARFAGVRDGDTVLDVGSGTGASRRASRSWRLPAASWASIRQRRT